MIIITDKEAEELETAEEPTPAPSTDAAESLAAFVIGVILAVTIIRFAGRPGLTMYDFYVLLALGFMVCLVVILAAIAGMHK